MLLPTSLVGSYPQPDWLIDRAKLAGRFPPRVRARELWRVAPEFLGQAQDDATLLAIRAQEDAGLDIVTDGEIRRESYSNRFATALDGVDIDNPGTALDRSGHPNPVPRVTGPIRRKHPVEVADLSFLRDHTSRTVKITVPGPFTMAQQAQDDYYGSREALAFGYAEAVNEEIRDLFAAGRRHRAARRAVPAGPPGRGRAVRRQGDQPGARRRDRARDDRAAHLLRLRRDHPRAARRATRSCPSSPRATSTRSRSRPRSRTWTARCSARLTGKTIILGVIDLSDPAVETPEVVAERVRRALPYVPASRLVLAPDCGMKYIPRETANGKMAAMAAAAAQLRAELG